MLIVRSPAKINLTLDVVGRRADGYHLLESVMQSIDLSDFVTLTPLGGDDARVVLNGNGVNAAAVPTDESNLARRAVRALREAMLEAGRAPEEVVTELVYEKAAQNRSGAWIIDLRGGQETRYRARMRP